MKKYTVMLLTMFNRSLQNVTLLNSHYPPLLHSHPEFQIALCRAFRQEERGDSQEVRIRGRK